MTRCLEQSYTPDAAEQASQRGVTGTGTGRGVGR